MADNDIHPFSAALETWYASHGRDLPWRGTHDPYRIWVSEIILQQTRVAQGYDYFMRFMERFPTVERLAAATEDDVLHAWQGLGYYTRARNLHAAARAVVAQGGFPADYVGVRALRGVGDYTAAAICSMAYGLPHAVVDGNVYRVLSRYFGLSTPIDTTSGRRAFADLAASLLDRRRPGLYNQAVMDFGALQCLPRAPQCGTCPLAPGCEALRTGRVDELPVKARRTQVAERFIAYIYICVSGDVLLHRRPAGDIWAGLYEPLLVEFDHRPAESEVLAAAPLVPFMPSRGVWRCVAQGVRHVLTHRVLLADFYQLSLSSLDIVPEGFVRVPETRRGDYAVPRLVSLLYERLGR